jgi:hypothetical protein
VGQERDSERRVRFTHGMTLLDSGKPLQS